MVSSYHTLGPGTETTAESSDTTDEVYEVLSHADRRFVLAHLHREDDTVTPQALSTALAESNDGLTRDDARIALHHVHLPKLSEAGFVEYDGDAVRLTDDAAEPLGLIGEA